MTCVHKVRWSVKRPEECRFRLSVSHYKDRIVAPDEYSGATEVTPSDAEQVLATKGKTVRANITVNPAPTESLATSENGIFVPSSGNVGFSEVVVDVPPTVPALQGKAVNPSETMQHITADSGYDGLSVVDVGAIPSSYIGSAVTRRTSSDLSASGNTVSVPSGYYAESGSKSVQAGTAGTPTATKGTVSNHSIAVTPAVSNTEGYISGGTKTGNAVTVSASELVSGTESITQNGTYDVANKASAVVNVPSQAPVLDSLSVTENGTYTPESGVDGFDEVVVNVPTGEETWDGTLYPITDETDPIYESKPFGAHWVQLSAGDTIIIEGYGRGRWVGFRGVTTTTISSLPSTVNIGVRSAPQFDYLRFRFDAVEDCIAVLASSNGSREGTHSGQVAYCFCGDYLRWKVIHAS